MFIGQGDSLDRGMIRSSRVSHQPGKGVPDRGVSASVLL